MGAGRPNKYVTNIEPYIHEIRVLRENNVEYSKIAKMLNIAESTLYKHKAQIEEFAEYIKKGDETVIANYEKSLHSLANGTYVAVREKIVYEADKKTVRSYEVTKEYGKPELGAVIFGLTNMAPEKWSNTQTINLESNDDISPSFKEVVKKQYETNEQ